MATTAAPQSFVDSLERVLSHLVSERQRLRAQAAPRAELEANRLAIVAMQWRLTRALGHQHRPGRSAAI